jgi:hypothetical protein
MHLALRAALESIRLTSSTTETYCRSAFRSELSDVQAIFVYTNRASSGNLSPFSLLGWGGPTRATEAPLNSVFFLEPASDEQHCYI